MAMFVMKTRVAPWDGRGSEVGGNSEEPAITHAHCVQNAMSALPPIADMCSALGHVRFVPIADIDRQFEAPVPSSDPLVSGRPG